MLFSQETGEYFIGMNILLLSLIKFLKKTSRMVLHKQRYVQIHAVFFIIETFDKKYNWQMGAIDAYMKQNWYHKMIKNWTAHHYLQILYIQGGKCDFFLSSLHKNRKRLEVLDIDKVIMCCVFIQSRTNKGHWFLHICISSTQIPKEIGWLARLR